MSRPEPPGHLAWCDTWVDGRRVAYGVGGPDGGLPVLFVHGWSLGRKAYKRALKRLARSGCRVYAPALPELGGTERLPAGRSDLVGYGTWATGFLDAVGVDEPALVIGHSLGGAVAAQLAADHPDRVSRLVLINSLGAPVWVDRPGGARHLRDRPLWHWALSFTRDLAAPRELVPTVRAVAEDLLPNLVRNPLGVWRSAMVARRADLSNELAVLRQSGVPVTVVTGEADLVVPRSTFDALCRALGVEGLVVPGGHSWMLAAPDAFASVIAQVVSSALATRRASAPLRVLRAANE